MNNNDKLIIGGHEFSSRFILGSGKYSMKLIEAAIKDAGAEIITLAVRRANTKEHENILDYIPEGITLLPNTSGARTAEEAVRIARLARELGCGNFVKVEIMRDTKYLLPDKYLVAASGMAGMGVTNSIKTRRITSRFYLCGDETSDVSDDIGLVAPRVALCAAHQALTVLRILAKQFEV